MEEKIGQFTDDSCVSEPLTKRFKSNDVKNSSKDSSNITAGDSLSLKYVKGNLECADTLDSRNLYKNNDNNRTLTELNKKSEPDEVENTFENDFNDASDSPFDKCSANLNDSVKTLSNFDDELLKASNDELLLNFGQALEDDEFEKELKYRLWDGLLGRPTRTLQFPGAQPVSFRRPHLQSLEREDYYVCEKSDGVRYLLYFTRPYGHSAAFLIDRNFSCRVLPGLSIPSRRGDGSMVQEDTLLDGEFILENVSDNVIASAGLSNKSKGPDLAPPAENNSPEASLTDEMGHCEKKQFKFTFLIFDALLVDGECVMAESLPNRLKKVQNNVIAPLKGNSDSLSSMPFSLEMKKMWKPYAIAEILEMEIPKQLHGNDGLIFTPVKDPYQSGTCQRLLKWKPSYMNTVDFLLEYNESAADENERLELYVGTRDQQHRFFAFHRWDPSLVKHAKCVIECRLAPSYLALIESKGRLGGSEAGGEEEGSFSWEFMRVRLDKKGGNNEIVVKRIMESITDNVTSKQLIDAIPSIRRSWKQREQETSQDRRNGSAFPLISRHDHNS